MASEEPAASPAASKATDEASSISISTPATELAATPDKSPAAASEAEASSSKAPAPAPAPAPAAEAKPKKMVRRIVGKNYDLDPALYIFTSLTAGNMHIVTATSRLETILRANRVPFKATDLSTDVKARQLWARRAGKTAEGKPRKMPALVQMGDVLGDLTEIEEWNEYGELKQHVKIYFDEHTQPPKGSVAPVPKYSQPANKDAHPPAVLNFPPPAPVQPSEAQVQSNKIASAISAGHPKQQSAKSMAEEAADKANARAAAARKARIEELKAKVQKDKDGSASSEDVVKAGEASATAATPETKTEPPTEGLSNLSLATQPLASPGTSGLQSPTSGAWKETGGSIEDNLRTTIQSPMSTSWKPPAETSLAEDTFAGAKVVSVSAEEAKKIEDQEMIKEEPEPAEEGENAADAK
ncbi:unnamed protein product [Discula destructiva]